MMTACTIAVTDGTQRGRLCDIVLDDTGKLVRHVCVGGGVEVGWLLWGV